MGCYGSLGFLAGEPMDAGCLQYLAVLNVRSAAFGLIVVIGYYPLTAPARCLHLRPTLILCLSAPVISVTPLFCGPSMSVETSLA